MKLGQGIELGWFPMTQSQDALFHKQQHTQHTQIRYGHRHHRQRLNIHVVYHMIKVSKDIVLSSPAMSPSIHSITVLQLQSGDYHTLKAQTPIRTAQTYRSQSINTSCHINQLPLEILYDIFEYLTTYDLARVTSVSKKVSARSGAGQSLLMSPSSEMLLRHYSFGNISTCQILLLDGKLKINCLHP